MALRDNPLMCAVYARDSRLLGDYVRRQDVGRYTRRMMLGAESVQKMQAAGLLRGDLRPQAIAYLFSIIALGFTSIGSIFPDSEAPPWEEIGAALAAMLQAGLETPGVDNLAGKQIFGQMIDFMRQQYDEPVET